ncbi:hypothetical protein [Rhizobium binxianense]
MTPTDARPRLIDLLGAVAAYNDKGYQWSGHDKAQIRLYQKEAQEKIVQLVAEIGEQAFSPALLDRLLSGEASRDWSGSIFFQARDELG